MFPIKEINRNYFSASHDFPGMGLSKKSCMYYLFIYPFLRSFIYSVHVVRDNLQELGISFHYMGSRDGTRVIWLGSRRLYPLGHLIGPEKLHLEVPEFY